MKKDPATSHVRMMRQIADRLEECENNLDANLLKFKAPDPVFEGFSKCQKWLSKHGWGNKLSDADMGLYELYMEIQRRASECFDHGASWENPTEDFIYLSFRLSQMIPRLRVTADLVEEEASEKKDRLKRKKCNARA